VRILDADDNPVQRSLLKRPSDPGWSKLASLAAMVAGDPGSRGRIVDEHEGATQRLRKGDMALLNETTRVASAILLSAIAVLTQAQTPPAKDLAQVSLEDLMNIEVTSVSKKEQKLSETGAAVYVITQEDIRRSGATNLPDVLRMAPGVEVAQIDANSWAVSIRGFNLLYANKVLVLIDGRSVYSPTFSGTMWNQQQVPLEDIERIEIIRGAGGTVWGANAVNGVINIITKSAKATTGGLVAASAGSQTMGDGLVQYGGEVGDKGAYRVFASASKTGDAGSPSGYSAADQGHMMQGGFRSDWQLDQRDSLTVQGDVLHTRAGEEYLAAGALVPAQGLVSDVGQSDSGNLLARWNRTLAGGSDISLQAYVAPESWVLQGFHESRTTTDLEFKHHWKLGTRNDLVWGLGYWISSDHLTPSATTAILPDHRTDQLYSAFVQDEIRLGPGVSLVLGSRFEHNSYTGFEFEPSGQLVWSASARQTLWFSATRASREPSRTDFGVQSDYGAIPFGNSTAILRVYGNPMLKSEQVLDFGAGYRVQANKRLSFDLTPFLSYYRDLQTDEPGAPFIQTADGQPQLIIPIVFNYLAHARNYGGEAFANWTVSNRWSLFGSFTLLHMNITRDASSQDTTVEASTGNSPKHEFQIRSRFTPRPRWDWDVSLAYTGALEALNIPAIPRVDTRLAYRISELIELSVTGSNLLQPRHAEYGDQDGLLHTLVERSVSGKVTWRF
jgi:iron complex outermembrane receptor protein